MNLVFRKIRKGNIKEFERIFRELYAPLCAYANKYLKDRDKSEEIVQNIFYNLWKDREKREIKISLKSYLYKAVQNNCFQLAKHAEVKEKYRTYIKNKPENYSLDPFQEMQLQEMNETINQTLDSLPEKCKEIFSLSRFEGLKQREIAEKLSISQKTVEANIGKALKAFRLSLKE